MSELIDPRLVYLVFFAAGLAAIGFLLRWSRRKDQRERDAMRRHIWRVY